MHQNKINFNVSFYSLLYFRGIYYHLTQTWCGIGNLDPAESIRKIDPQNQQIKPVQNHQIKPVENQQTKPAENQQIKPAENQ